MASISTHLCLFVVVLDIVFGSSEARKLSVAKRLLDEEEAGGGSGGGSDASMQCVQKLIPCQQFLKQPEKASPACCLPLKQMLSEDSDCLCKLFDSQGMMGKLDITPENALKLPKACGVINADVSICKNGASSPATSPASNNNSSSSSNAPGSPKSEACAPAHLGRYGFVGLFMAVAIVTAF